MPNIGELRQIIKIQKPAAERSGTGQEVLTWSDYGEFWAKVEYARTGSGEAVQTDREIVSNRLIFYLRKQVFISERDRIIYRGRPYDVIIVREMPPHFLEIVAIYQGDAGALSF